MAIFTVHLPPAPAGAPPAPEKIVFLRDDGFAWPAFFFGPFWLAWHKAWLATLLWTLALAALGLLGWKLHISGDVLSWAGLAMSVLLGYEGSRLVAWTLARRGFTESAVVIGDSADEAEEVFFHNWRKPAPVEPPVAVLDGAAGERRA
jgi:hypothetical protein